MRNASRGDEGVLQQAHGEMSECGTLAPCSPTTSCQTSPCRSSENRSLVIMPCKGLCTVLSVRVSSADVPVVGPAVPSRAYSAHATQQIESDETWKFHRGFVVSVEMEQRLNVCSMAKKKYKKTFLRLFWESLWKPEWRGIQLMSWPNFPSFLQDSRYVRCEIRTFFLASWPPSFTGMHSLFSIQLLLV